MSPAVKTLGILWLIGILAGGLGCVHWQYDLDPAPSWNPTGLATPRIITADNIFVHPHSANLRMSRAGVLIFRTAPDFAEVGPAFTRIFHQELQAKRTFAEVVYIPEIYSTKEDAMSLAKRHNLDLLVLGEVPYYLDGGTVANSGLQVDLKVIDAKSGQLLWSISGSIKAVRRPIIDLWVVETRPYPTPPMGVLAARLAAKMAETLERGGPPPPPTGLASVFPKFNGD
ncbi:MAG: hypothetical protein P8X65_03650 [Syntrophobacterales bacterium]